MERIEQTTAGHNQQFGPLVIAGDDDHVTLVRDMSEDQADVQWSGSVGGRIAEVWNLHSMDAYWA